MGKQVNAEGFELAHPSRPAKPRKPALPPVGMRDGRASGGKGGMLRTGGTSANQGRKPNSFKAEMRALASNRATLDAVGQILKDPDHGSFVPALKLAAEYGYGKPKQPVAHQGQVTLVVEYTEDDE